MHYMEVDRLQDELQHELPEQFTSGYYTYRKLPDLFQSKFWYDKISELLRLPTVLCHYEIQALNEILVGGKVVERRPRTDKRTLERIFQQLPIKIRRI